VTSGGGKQSAVKTVIGGTTAFLATVWSLAEDDEEGDEEDDKDADEEDDVGVASARVAVARVLDMASSARRQKDSSSVWRTIMASAVFVRANAIALPISRNCTTLDTSRDRGNCSRREDADDNDEDSARE
jgi:hypothetical protein